MSEILEYKCPNCGAPLTFNGETQQMYCESCESSFATEYIKQDEKLREKAKEINEDVNIKWEDYHNETLDDENMKMYSCTSCGAEIVGDDSTAATHCLYCGSPAIMVKQLSGIYKPDYVIPFKMGKPDAKEAILKLCKGKKLLPKGFKDENHIEEIKGVYVPFWLFDCGAHANIDFTATKVTTWSDKKYRYTKTDHYSLNRTGNLDFTRVPIDGSSKVDNILMESVEPFDYNELTDFKTAYLSGYLADKYDVESDACKDRVNERIKNSTTSVLRDTIESGRYTTVIATNTNIKVGQGKINYALLPVWMLNTKYQDKIYTFIMNGQTGKFIGKLPTSMGKYFAWLGGISAGIFAVLAALIMFVR